MYRYACIDYYHYCTEVIIIKVFLFVLTVQTRDFVLYDIVVGIVNITFIHMAAVTAVVGRTLGGGVRCILVRFTSRGGLVTDRGCPGQW